MIKCFNNRVSVLDFLAMMMLLRLLGDKAPWMGEVPIEVSYNKKIEI